MNRQRYNQLLKKLSLPDLIEFLELHELIMSEEVYAVNTGEKGLLYAGRVQEVKNLRKKLTRVMQNGGK